MSTSIFWIITLSLVAAMAMAYSWQEYRQRKNIQNELQGEILFRRTMENSMVTGMQTLDLNERISYVNPAFARITGWPALELLGQTTPYSYWLQEDHERLLALHAKALRDAKPSTFRLRVRRKSGQTIDARVHISRLIGADGCHQGWISTLSDITEPNRIRRQLASAHERFTMVLQALDASVSVVPLGSRELLFANKRYRQWFGTTSAGHLNLLRQGSTLQTLEKFQDHSPTEDIHAHSRTPVSDLPGKGSAEIYLQELGLWLEIRTRYLNWVDGRLVQLLIATDISSRKIAQEQAALHAERAQTTHRMISMGEMASSVAHELNQPLTAIVNYCNGMISRLKDKKISAQELLPVLEKTARQAHRAGQVVEHVRSFVKRSEPHYQKAQVSEMVTHAANALELELQRKGIQLHTALPPRLPSLDCDPILIEQVLINLIRNAMDATEDAQLPQKLRVIDLLVDKRPDTHAPSISFRVRDRGKGMNEQTRLRIYEALYSTKNKGMGIGLNLCRSIVEAHQGRISGQNIYNQEEKKIAGCEFHFWIPLHRKPL